MPENPEIPKNHENYFFFVVAGHPLIVHWAVCFLGIFYINIFRFYLISFSFHELISLSGLGIEIFLKVQIFTNFWYSMHVYKDIFQIKL